MIELAKEFGFNIDKPKHYLEIYTELFKNLREKELRILEIGVSFGGSVKMLERYFPVSQITGIDIHPERCLYTGGRLKLIDGDQADEEFLKTLEPFDIIIDDGGHKMSQQQTSFKILYPKLKEKGIYIIEDLCTSYWGEFMDSEPTTIDFLKSLIDTVNREGILNDRSSRKGLDFPKYEINSISFYPSLCVIKK